jgi:hypothetical protein
MYLSSQHDHPYSLNKTTSILDWPLIIRLDRRHLILIHKVPSIIFNFLEESNWESKQARERDNLVPTLRRQFVSIK